MLWSSVSTNGAEDPTALITCRPTGGPQLHSIADPHKNREDGTHFKGNHFAFFTNRND